MLLLLRAGRMSMGIEARLSVVQVEERVRIRVLLIRVVGKRRSSSRGKDTRREKLLVLVRGGRIRGLRMEWRLKHDYRHPRQHEMYRRNMSFFVLFIIRQRA